MSEENKKNNDDMTTGQKVGVGIALTAVGVGIGLICSSAFMPEKEGLVNYYGVEIIEPENTEKESETLPEIESNLDEEMMLDYGVPSTSWGWK